jgi:hypothetical protein
VEVFSVEGANPKLEILKSLMWNMGYEIYAGTRLFAYEFYLTSQISHPLLTKGIT